MTSTDTAAPPAQGAASGSTLSGWISRYDLAQELDLSVDTLGRWERLRKGPACVRAGRKVLYRVSVVQCWLESQELPRVGEATGKRGRA